MPDITSEEEIRKLVRHGENTLQNMKRVSAWCTHTRIERSGGVGLIEQMYNVPIGHMGVRCAHAPAGGMMCWDLADAFLHHYERNCKSCKMRSAGVGPDMQPTIDQYEARKQKDEHDRHVREAADAQALQERRLERQKTFDADNPVQADLCELLDKIDVDGDKPSGEKLVEFAKLAPDAFNQKIVTYLESLVENDISGLARAAGNTLLSLADYPKAKTILIALKRCEFGMSEQVASVIEQHADSINEPDVDRLLDPLAYLAIPSRGIFHQEQVSRPGPLSAVIKAHPKAVAVAINRRLGGEAHDVQTAARLISVATAIDPELTKQFQRDIFSKLLRNKRLLPELSKRRSGGEGLSAIRDAASSLFEADPEASDHLIQSFCQHASDDVLNEVARLYRIILREDMNYDAPPIEPTAPKKLAFSRLLWMAVADPGNLHNEALATFRYASKPLLKIAETELDNLIGAAAALGATRERLSAETSIEKPKTGFEAIELNQRLGSVDSLQSDLIKWAFSAAKESGAQKIRELLQIYDALPENDIMMRSAMLKHLTLLIVDTGTFNAVLPHLYKGMTDAEALIRGHAAEAVGDAKFEIQRDFPSLIFEVYLALLTDPIMFVHKTAVRHLHSHNFPEEQKPHVASALINLIFAYAQGKDDDTFLVECMSSYAQGFLTDSNLTGAQGKVLVKIIEGLEPYAAHKAVERLKYSLKNTEGFGRVLGSMFESDWAPDLAHSELLKAFFQMPPHIVREAVDSIEQTAKVFYSKQVWRSELFVSLLCKAGEYERANRLCHDLLQTLEVHKENEFARMHLETLAQITAFEMLDKKDQQSINKASERWEEHLGRIQRWRRESDEQRTDPPFFQF